MRYGALLEAVKILFCDFVVVFYYVGEASFRAFRIVLLVGLA